jgi:Nucleosome assembly protein (NAP)
LEELEEKLEMDYQIGEDIKEKIIPKAIDYFTGKALEFDMMDEEDDDFDDIDDDDDDDEDEDEDGLVSMLFYRYSITHICGGSRIRIRMLMCRPRNVVLPRVAEVDKLPIQKNANSSDGIHDPPCFYLQLFLVHRRPFKRSRSVSEMFLLRFSVPLQISVVRCSI